MNDEEIKVSELDSVEEIRDTDQIMVIQGGTNKKATGKMINDKTISNSYGTEEGMGYSQKYLNDDLVNVGDTINNNFKTNILISNNLFGAIPLTETKNGITLTNNGDGTFNLTGTATAQTEFIWWKNYNEFRSLMKQNAPWRSYVNKNSDNVIYQISTWNGTTSSPIWVSTPIQFTQTQTDKIISSNTFGSLVRFNIQVNNGATINLTNVQVSLEITNKTITYNKYIDKTEQGIFINGEGIFHNEKKLTELLGSTYFSQGTSYHLNDDITNYKCVMLLLSSGGADQNATRQYIPVSQILNFTTDYRCALSLFQSTSVFIFADFYFDAANSIKCNGYTKGTTGWNGFIKVYGIK